MEENKIIGKEKLFEIYNGFNSNLLSDDIIIKAKTGKEAVKKLLKQLNIKYTKIKCSGDNDVMIKTTPFYFGENGKKYKDGHISWWAVIN